MKGLVCLICSIIMIFTAHIPGGAQDSVASLSPGLDVISASAGMVVSAVSGNTVVFTAEDFTECYMIDGDFSITVVSLPDAATGVLKVGNSPVAAGQVLTSESLNTMRFTPAEDCAETSFVFTFDGMYDAPCSVRFTDGVNFAPDTADAIETWTATDVLCAGYLRANDPEGDGLRYELVSAPENGIVTVGADGKYVYTPYAGMYGVDSFKYRARDEFGNYSAVSSVTVTVEKSDSTLVFADMGETPSYAAAISVVSDGIMEAREADGEYLFDPLEKMTRLDFLVCAMDAFGAENVPTVSATNFADDADIPEEYKGYVSAATSLGLVSGTKDGGLTYFEPERYVTCEEAAVILNRILGIMTDEDTPEVFGNVSDWAEEDVAALCDAGIADPYSDFSAELDRASCAGLICGAQRFFD